jgi:predicted acetyltransferase
MSIKLVLPSVKYEKDIIKTRGEIIQMPNGDVIDGQWYFHPNKIEDIVQKSYNNRNGIDLPAGMVPETAFWIINDNDEYVGRISIRHMLTGNLRTFGGHIGYNIRPSHWRKGYATEALGLALLEANKIGLNKVLVTCDKDNIGSKKVIEANGGVLENELMNPESGVIKLRYWMDLTGLEGSDAK